MVNLLPILRRIGDTQPASPLLRVFTSSGLSRIILVCSGTAARRGRRNCGVLSGLCPTLAAHVRSLGGWSKVTVLGSLFVHGFILVSDLSVGFSGNFSIVANRANTKGSVVLKTLSLILKRHTSKGDVGGNSRGYIVRTIFSISQCGLRRFFLAGSLRCSTRVYVLHQRLFTSNGSHTFMGSSPIPLSMIGRLKDQLVSVRSRRRGLLLKSGQFRLGMVSMVTRGSVLLVLCQGRCDQCLSLGGRLGRLARGTLRAGRRRSCMHFRLRRLTSTNLITNRRRRLRRRLRALSRTRRVGNSLCGVAQLLSKRRRKTIRLVGRTLSATSDLRHCCPGTGRVTRHLHSTCVSVGSLTSRARILGRSVRFGPRHLS